MGGKKSVTKNNDIIKKNPNTDEKLLFMNSWNEWGEGCVLEPDSVKGNQILRQTREVISDIDKYYIETSDLK